MQITHTKTYNVITINLLCAVIGFSLCLVFIGRQQMHTDALSISTCAFYSHKSSFANPHFCRVSLSLFLVVKTLNKCSELLPHNYF